MCFSNFDFGWGGGGLQPGGPVLGGPLYCKALQHSVANEDSATVSNRQPKLGELICVAVKSLTELQLAAGLSV